MSVPVRSATAEHAALVRSALTLDERVQGGNKGPLAALAALVALAEQADDLLRQRTELQNSIGNNVVTVDTLVREKSEGWTRALSAEARVAELEDALWDIVDEHENATADLDAFEYHGGHVGIARHDRAVLQGLGTCADIARSVLDAGSPTGQEQRPAKTHTVRFECGHDATIWDEEYGDGSAWCQACGEFRCYERPAGQEQQA